jgi:hypothetical protein
MAGFELTLYGRFWVNAKALEAESPMLLDSAFRRIPYVAELSESTCLEELTT